MGSLMLIMTPYFCQKNFKKQFLVGVGRGVFFGFCGFYFDLGSCPKRKVLKLCDFAKIKNQC
jgi:hypothetical protein